MKALRFGFAIDRTAGYKNQRRRMQARVRPRIRAVDLDEILWRDDDDGQARAIAVVELTVFDKAYPMYGACLDQTLERVQRNPAQFDSLIVTAEALGVSAWLVPFHIGDMRESDLTPLQQAEVEPVAFWAFNLTDGLGWFPQKRLDVGVSPAVFYAWLEALPLGAPVAT